MPFTTLRFSGHCRAWHGHHIEAMHHHTSPMSYNYRILWVEGNFRGQLAQPPAVSGDIFNQTRLLRAPSSLALNVSRDGASTTSLGNLSQCFTTLTVKNFSLTSSLNLPSLSLKPLLLVLPQQALLKKIFPIFLICPFQVLEDCYKVSSQERCFSPLMGFVTLLWRVSASAFTANALLYGLLPFRGSAGQSC